jgi:hypothetical protein
LPLLPETKDILQEMPFDGQPIRWRLQWSAKTVDEQGSPITRQVAAFEVHLGRDRTWKAYPLAWGPRDPGRRRLPGGEWNGTWSWDAKTRTLSVRERRKGGRWYNWSVRIAKDRRGGWTKGDFAERSLCFTALPPPGGYHGNWNQGRIRWFR